MGMFNLLGGQSNLLGGQMSIHLTCYLPPWFVIAKYIHTYLTRIFSAENGMFRAQLIRFSPVEVDFDGFV